ncbi:MAG: hypothetical protein HC923_11125 [Myxococcales bacterium]|nr:hypothetical protein [Myxococcales bacterium]
MVAALHQWTSGELDPHYTFRAWLGPNRLFYVLGAGLSPALGPVLASNLLLALAMGSLAPSAYYLMRQAGRTGAFAVLVVPLAAGQVVSTGFTQNLLALSLFFLTLGLALRVQATPSVGSRALYVVAGVLTVLTHLFMGLALTGLLALGFVIAFARRRLRDGITHAAAATFTGSAAIFTMPTSGGPSSLFDRLSALLRVSSFNPCHGSPATIGFGTSAFSGLSSWMTSCKP